MATRRHAHTLTAEELHALLQEMAQVQLTVLRRLDMNDPTIAQAEQDLRNLCTRLGLEETAEDEEDK